MSIKNIYKYEDNSPAAIIVSVFTNSSIYIDWLHWYIMGQCILQNTISASSGNLNVHQLNLHICIKKGWIYDAAVWPGGSGFYTQSTRTSKLHRWHNRCWSQAIGAVPSVLLVCTSILGIKTRPAWVLHGYDPMFIGSWPWNFYVWKALVHYVPMKPIYVYTAICKYQNYYSRWDSVCYLYYFFYSTRSFNYVCTIKNIFYMKIVFVTTPYPPKSCFLLGKWCSFLLLFDCYSKHAHV